MAALRHEWVIDRKADHFYAAGPPSPELLVVQLAGAPKATDPGNIVWPSPPVGERKILFMAQSPQHN